MGKSILFDSWHQWKVCFLSGCSKAGWGIMRILSCIVLGFLSIVRWLWRFVGRFVSVYPEISIATAVVTVILVWLLTFMSMRARAVGAESQRDSISWEFYQFKKGHGYE